LLEGTAVPFCPRCGTAVSADASFCPSCGQRLQTTPQPNTAPPKPVITESKNPGVAALLALLIGLFGVWGIGHVYVGKIGKGLLLLVIGIVLNVLSVGALLLGIIGFPSTLLGVGSLFGIGLTASILLGIVTWVLWVWQTYDAYKLAKEFNAYVQQHGKAPW
jgi:TM2 domain-containing membrane protein YozV